MKDLGELHHFLGIQVVQSSTGLFLSQQKYVLDLLNKFHLHTVKPNLLVPVLLLERPWLMVNCLLILLSTEVW